MSHPTKRILSTIAIAIASVTFGVLISADLGLMPASSAQSAPIQTTQGAVTSVTIPSFADVAARAMPAVVSISTTEIVRGAARRRSFGIDPFEFFFPDPRDPRRRQAPEDDEQRQLSGGSGFIISPDGYILTNNHVVENAAKVEISYGADENGGGGRVVPATIVGRDPATDLALLKIDAQQLPVIPLGDSDRIRRGDWAIAIGSPFRLDNTLTVGVISAKGRSLGISEQTQSFENFIQTDAAINFGNSGGPLLNINGEVIGINTAMRGGLAQGLGFATPVNVARRLLPQLKQGKVVRSFLGMEIREVNHEIREAWNLPPGTTGALVNNVTPGRPAAAAGLQHGDIIIEIDGRPIRSNRELIDYISYLPVGTEVRVTFIRNGARRTVTAKTAERPLDGVVDDEEGASAIEPVRNRLGMAVQDLTPQLRQLYGHDDTIRGVLVTNVRNVSAAGEANILEGDVIMEVQGQRVNNVEEFRRIIESARSGQKIRMYVTTPAGRTRTPFTRYTILTVP
ncbi:MAG TPA: Do family serine endopeptidase [Thermoanaerobaculia bacterium]|nr:Do family serine endopeptidase [Thermoanaerobaculia bacterium]